MISKTAKAGAARPNRRETAANETPRMMWGKGHNKIVWWTLVPALAVTAICTQAIAIANTENTVIRRPGPPDRGDRTRAKPSANGIQFAVGCPASFAKKAEARSSSILGG